MSYVVLRPIQHGLNGLEEAARATFLQFHEADQLDEAQDSVDAAEPWDAHDFTSWMVTAAHELKWYDGDQVDKEPSCQVILSDCESVLDESHLLVVYADIEGDKHIEQEHDVNDVVED